MEPMPMIRILSDELGLRFDQVQRTVELLDAGNTVPFIARYRKEMTGSLDEDQIRAVEERIRYLGNMEERKQTILKSITDQGKLTPELESQIQSCSKLQELEDLYLPYKPKRRTRAAVAKEKGLEPLAELIYKQEIIDGDPFTAASAFVDTDKGVSSSLDALAGARDIVAEWISENFDLRKHLREATYQNGFLSSSVMHAEKAEDYVMYKQFSEPGAGHQSGRT